MSLNLHNKIFKGGTKGSKTHDKGCRVGIKSSKADTKDRSADNQGYKTTWTRFLRPHDPRVPTVSYKLYPGRQIGRETGRQTRKGTG